MSLSHLQQTQGPDPRSADTPARTPGRETLTEGVAGAGALPGPVRSRMETSFGSDFSSVRVHQGASADQLGARAFAQGNDLHFAPGEYRPGTPEGDELIGHELAHVVQQRQGRVSAPQGKGAPVNADEGLEHEADVAGAAAARGQSAGIGSSNGSVGGSAPIQLKKKGWEKGTELTEHQAGSKEAKRDYLELMDADDKTRAAKIASLFDGRTKSKNQRFYHLQTWLMGNNAGLETAYQTKTGRTLRSDLGTHLSKEQRDYCVSVIENGHPLLEDQVRLAMGVLTGSAADDKELMLLFIGDKDHKVEEADKLRAWSKLSSFLQQKLKPEKYRQLETHIHSIQLKTVLSNQTGPITKEQHDENKTAMLDQKDRELTALGLAQKGTLSMNRAKLGEVITDWARRHDDETRQYVTRPGSQFVTMLHSQVVRLPFGKEVLFTSNDVTYAIATVRDANQIDDKFFRDGETVDTMPTDKAKEKRTEARSEEGAGHSEFTAWFERKENNGTTFKWQWTSMKERVDEMSEEQKDWFLRSNLSSADQDLWDDEETPHDTIMALREQAIATIHDRLLDMGMKGPAIPVIGGGDSMRKTIVEMFRYGSTQGSGGSGSTYKRLLSHANESMKPEKFGKKAVALCRKLRGDEFAHVRGNPGLMANLQSKASPKYWDRIQSMLGITSGTHDGAKGDVDKDVLNAKESEFNSWGAKVELKKYDLEDGREHGANEAELMPSHWGMVLTAALKEASTLRRTEINSLVTRTWTAGKKRERLTANGPLKLSGDRKLDPMTPSDFVIAAYNSISAGGLKVLNSHKNGKLHHAYEALTTGTRVTVDHQLDDARFTNPLKHTSGTHASVKAINFTFDDIDGADLLAEWSNIEILRGYKRAHDIAVHDGDTAEAQDRAEQIRDFVIDVRDDRIKYLHKTLPPKEHVKTLSKIRKKLASAAASDPEVIEALSKTGFKNDELSQARTKNLAMLDEQRMRGTGAQYNTFLGGKSQVKALGKTVIGSSSSSAQTKESAGILLGHTRKAQTDLRSGVDRSKVLEDHGKNIKDSQDELDRRGKAFDKMQKQFNTVALFLAKALVHAVIAAAMTAITVLTGGLGGVAGVLLIAGKVALSQSVMMAVKANLEGDAFNVEKALYDLAFKTVISTGFGVAGEFGVPAILEGVGEQPLTHGNVLTSSSTFGAPTDPGSGALRVALEQGMGKSGKKLMAQALKAARDPNGSNPAHRKLLLIQLGGKIAVLGAKVGAEAYGQWNEDVQDGNESTQLEKKAVGSGDKVVSKAPKGLKIGFRILEEKFKPVKTQHGEGRGTDAEAIVQRAIGAAETEAQSLKKAEQAARKNGEDTSLIEQRWTDVVTRLYDLLDLFEAWQQKMRGKGKDDVLDKVKGDNTKIIEAAFNLMAFIATPDPRLQPQTQQLTQQQPPP